MNKIKKIAIVVGSTAGLLLARSVGAIDPVLTLPVGFIGDALAYVGQLFTDLNLVIVLVIGLPLAFWVIRKTISLVRAR